jgi:hypothetical protein
MGSTGENLEMLSKYKIKKINVCSFFVNIHDFSAKSFDEIKPHLKYLKDLEFGRLYLDKLDKATFKCYASTLERLSLTLGEVKNSYPNPALEKLVNLRELEIRGVEYRYYMYGLKNLTKLTKLVLPDGGEKKLKKDMFKSLINLQWLDLKCESVNVIEAGAFNGLSNLTRLNLIGSSSTALKEGSLQGLNNLEELRLYSIKPESIQAKIFSGLSKLKSLDLRECPIELLHRGTFNGLSNLTHLNIEQCDLTILTEGVLQGLTNLEKLNFSSIKLAAIGARVFSGLSKLKIVEFGNAIEFIDPDAFDDSQNIDFLNLSGNKLGQFVTKCSPKKLNLSNNVDLKLVRFIGSDLANIEDVNLLHNNTLLKDFNSMFEQSKNLNIVNFNVNFEALDSDASFSHMKKLKRFAVYKIAPNHTIRISHSAFHGLTNLESLRLDFAFGSFHNESNSASILQTLIFML